MKKPVLWIVLAAVVAIGAYFADTAWQTQRGEAALQATGLAFLPLDQALAQAKAQGKPVLVDFSAIWCTTCRVLHAEVLTNDKVKLAIADGYVLSRVDYEAPEARAFMQRYGVQGFPTLLVLSAEGMLVRRVPISLDPATLAASLRG
jgi:thiol:disulfide interchange protein DsbD